MNDLWFALIAAEELNRRTNQTITDTAVMNNEANAKLDEENKIFRLRLEIAKAKSAGVDTTELERLLCDIEEVKRIKEEDVLQGALALEKEERKEEEDFINISLIGMVIVAAIVIVALIVIFCSLS